jgi:peroxiredoxin Q/BCP
LPKAKVPKKVKASPKTKAPAKAKAPAKQVAIANAAASPAKAPPALPPTVQPPAGPSSAASLFGRSAPAFSLDSSDGKRISLADYAAKTLVLYFYPRADTPGCTIEACAFRDARDLFSGKGIAVLGVSPDPAAHVTKFAKKFNLNFPLLADADHAVCEAYGVWVEKSMYGKKYMGAARTTFVIANGIVKHVFEKVKPEGHDAQVLEAIEKGS